MTGAVCVSSGARVEAEPMLSAFVRAANWRLLVAAASTPVVTAATNSFTPGPPVEASRCYMPIYIVGPDGWRSKAKAAGL